jgi:hypothetical protein
MEGGQGRKVSSIFFAFTNDEKMTKFDKNDDMECQPFR